MIANEVVLRLVAAFDRLGIPYMLVGSFSSNLYGRPRSTQDADFVVQLSPDSLDRLRQELGAEFHLDPQMSFETITATLRHVIQHGASDFTVELFLLSNDAHDRARFDRRQTADFKGIPVSVPSPEDVIITKLRWSRAGQRAKDIDDVRNVIAIQRDRLDLGYIRQWCDQHGTRGLLEQLLATTP